MGYKTDEPQAAMRQQKHVEILGAITRLEIAVDELGETLDKICGSPTAKSVPDVKAPAMPSLADFLAGEAGHINAVHERLLKLHAQLKEILF